MNSLFNLWDRLFARRNIPLRDKTGESENTSKDKVKGTSILKKATDIIGGALWWYFLVAVWVVVMYLLLKVFGFL
jgi:hypothetical protein